MGQKEILEEVNWRQDVCISRTITKKKFYQTCYWENNWFILVMDIYESYWQSAVRKITTDILTKWISENLWNYVAKMALSAQSIGTTILHRYSSRMKKRRSCGIGLHFYIWRADIKIMHRSIHEWLQLLCLRIRISWKRRRNHAEEPSPKRSSQRNIPSNNWTYIFLIGVFRIIFRNASATLWEHLTSLEVRRWLQYVEALICSGKCFISKMRLGTEFQ